MLNFAAGNPITGYNLTRSLRFRSSASAYLNRTATAGNRKTWTWSGWVKRGILSSANNSKFFGAGSSGTGGNTGFQFGFGEDNQSDDNLYIQQSTWGTSNALVIKSTATYRDPSAWYHIVLAVDTTQATDTNRVKLYVNGVQVTSFNSPSYPSQNTDLLVNNNGTTQFLGASAGYSAQRYFDGYLTEVNFIDGQALTPSSFGSTNSVSGVWQPAPYTGTYGTNGFYLPFTDNSALTTSSNVGLGKDFSGNGNYWITNNISITAGVTYDSMTDVPTLTSATAANFCIANPLDKQTDIAVAQGNLQISTTAGIGNKQIRGSIALPSSGKFYWETRNTGSANNFSMGVTTTTASLSAEGAGDVLYNENGIINNNGTTTSGFATLALNDIVGVAVDVDANKIYFYKNNTLVNSGGTTINITAPFAPMFGLYDNGNAQSITFGQRPFTYTPPTGFVALNTYNLPTSTIVKGNTVMDATLYTGNGSTQTITNAAGFRPDLVWYKARSVSYNNSLFDSVRGATKQIISNATDAEATLSGVTAFNSNGFSLGSDANGNNNTTTYVGWQWQAGQGSSSSNTNGTITSTVSVNASAGFSVVTYTGTGVAATVGHGLGVAPSWIIVKSRSASGQDWRVYTATVGNTGVVTLNSDGAALTGQSGFWNNTSPTSSVFSLGTAASTNGNGTTYVAYCWTPIAGYSAFSSYTGNGSNDGTFVYTGFRPRFVLIKSSSNVRNWRIIDTARDPYNYVRNELFPNLSNIETTANMNLDILSNGFKPRFSEAGYNGSGETYIYAAFAENPFKNSLAR